MSCLPVSLCAIHMPGAHGDQKKAWPTLELELQIYLFFKLLCGCKGSNLGSLQDHVLSVTEPSL